MNKIVNFMNRLTDMDWGWWPLLRFRPSEHEFIDFLVLSKITLFFGTIIGLSLAAIEGHLAFPRLLMTDILIGWAVFFIFFRITFAAAWNARAKELRKIRAQQRN